MNDLAAALQYNPFEGDFGDVGDRELRDKIVCFRKAGGCHTCGGDVKPGSFGRSLTMLWAADRTVTTYRYCTECTEAMACSWTDEGRALEARYARRGKIGRLLTLKVNASIKARWFLKPLAFCCYCLTRLGAISERTSQRLVEAGIDLRVEPLVSDNSH